MRGREAGKEGGRCGDLPYHSGKPGGKEGGWEVQ